MAFLGARPQDGQVVLQRESFLAPVKWTDDGWPVVNGNHHVALEMEAPRLKPHPFPEPSPKTLFKGGKLGPEWIQVRNPDPANFSLEARKGYLRIRTTKGSLDSPKENPAFVGQRQPAFRLSVRTEMEFTPVQDGEEAGICVRANDSNHFEIAVGRSGGQVEVFVRSRLKDESSILDRTPLKTGKAWLEISSSEGKYQFAWSADGKVWNRLGACAAEDLFREKASRFTGAVIGLYATSNGKESQSYADFAWYEVLK